MNLKQIVTVVLLVFVVGSVAAMMLMELKPAAVKSETVQQMETDPSANIKPNQQVIAYYFHGTARCITCRTIEAYTEEALKTMFADHLDSGRLIWIPVNVEIPDNRHFIQDYQLHTKSVVLSNHRDGQEVEWKNLDQIWQLVGNKDAFITYIWEETSKMLGETDG